MEWPEKPTCHDDDYRIQPPFYTVEAHWREPDTNTPFRTCWFCGSIHPEDLVEVLSSGGHLTGADWKYGWPHKFYVHMLNTTDPNREIMGRWYNEHLLDLNDDAFFSIAKLLEEYTDIKWIVTEDGKLGYEAPYEGYTKTTVDNGHH